MPTLWVPSLAVFAYPLFRRRPPLPTKLPDLAANRINNNSRPTPRLIKRRVASGRVWCRRRSLSRRRSTRRISSSPSSAVVAEKWTARLPSQSLQTTSSLLFPLLLRPRRLRRKSPSVSSSANSFAAPRPPATLSRSLSAIWTALRRPSRSSATV